MITESPAVGTAQPLYPLERRIALPWPGPLADSAGCARLASDGVSLVELLGDVDLARASALEALRFIRDCVATGVTVRWSVAHGGAVDPRWLMHLCPPERFPGHEELLQSWKDFAFGVLYWRRGPSFISIRDVRPACEPAYYTLESDGTLECFERLAVPCPVAQIPEREGEGFQNLREAQLVVEIEEQALALPYRVRKWPIPFMSV